MTGDQAQTDDIVRVARKFQDELTLNNLSRPQLISLARFMNLNAFGTDSLLRTMIENRLTELKTDDYMILEDGVESLTISELQHACSARGITTFGTSPARMRAELSQWLQLHLEHKIPSSLLLLSHAFQTTSRVLQPGTDALDSKASALQATLSSLPHQVINEASLKVSEQEGVATYKQKLDVLKEQEEMIADELEEQEAEEALKRSRLENEEAVKVALEEEIQKADDGKESEPIDHAILKALPEEKENKKVTEEEMELSKEESKKLANAVKEMSKEPIDKVKSSLSELKEDRQDFKEVDIINQRTWKNSNNSH
jgi:LETM1 and EF-hand domain-containing protein 1, mitochondrial